MMERPLMSADELKAMPKGEFIVMKTGLHPMKVKLTESLDGPNAIAISKDDATAPARTLAKFAKTAPALEIKAGVVEGNYYDADGMKEISSIPAREELLSRLLGSMQSPITNFARVIKQIAEKDGGAEGEQAQAEAPAEEAAPQE